MNTLPNNDPGRRQNSFLMLMLLFLPAIMPAATDPQQSSWLTTYAGKYARIYSSDSAKAAGNSSTTWSNGTLSQSLPAYCGVQEILYSTNYIYIRTSGLGSHIMGPWYLNAGRTQTFPNLPVNQRMIFRMPRTPVVPATRTYGFLGEIGMFVDGVRMFDAGDAFSYSTANGKDASPVANIGQGDGIWNRDAWVNESVTFDPGYAHQQNTGRYHYHASPIALRYLLGDHVDFNSSTKTYSESAGAVTKHSPILGWMHDGYPIYGPYGYSTATDSGSGLRRMVSGYAKRDGTNGTDNLTTTGRHSLPAVIARQRKISATLSASQYGPNVSVAYPIGQYMEDYAYLGDVGKTQGVDFDLDEYNGRYCVTPEYPGGTYAYFATINASGTPVYPYNMGRLYRGTPSGGLVNSITESVTSVFSGGPDSSSLTGVTATPNGGNVTLTWSSVEGGTYEVDSSSDQSAWAPLATGQAAASNAVQTSISKPGPAANYYRAIRTSLAAYDPVSLFDWHSTQVSVTANAAAGNRTGATHGTWQLYYYKGTDNNLWCCYWNGTAWVQTVLTSAGKVDDWVAAYAGWNIAYFKDTDGYLRCVYWTGSVWKEQTLGTNPNVQGDIVVDDLWHAVFYRGTDNRVWAAYWDGIQWVQVSLGASANVAGSLASDKSWHLIYYMGTDNLPWCYYWTGSVWTQVKLGTTANVGGSFTGDAAGLAYYRSSADNTPWAVYWTGSAWAQTQLDSTVSMDGAMTRFGHDVAVLLEGGACVSLYWNGSKWINVTVADGGWGLTGGLAVHPPNNWIFARRNDSNLVVFYYQ